MLGRRTPTSRTSSNTGRRSEDSTAGAPRRTGFSAWDSSREGPPLLSLLSPDPSSRSHTSRRPKGLSCKKFTLYIILQPTILPISVSRRQPEEPPVTVVIIHPTKEENCPEEPLSLPASRAHIGAPASPFGTFSIPASARILICQWWWCLKHCGQPS